jgi:hypothetical protein
MWNVMERSFERDIIPMAKSEGILPIPLPRHQPISKKNRLLTLICWLVRHGTRPVARPRRG